MFGPSPNVIDLSRSMKPDSICRGVRPKLIIDRFRFTRYYDHPRGVWCLRVTDLDRTTKLGL